MWGVNTLPQYYQSNEIEEMRWTGHVVRVEEVRGTYKIFV
jgi:hypothetical protein